LYRAIGAIDEEELLSFHPRKTRSGVPLETAPVLAVGEQFFLVDRPDGAVEGVEQRGGVSFREDELVGSRMVRTRDVVTEVTGEEDCSQLDSRERGGGMSGSCLVSGPQDVDPKLTTEILDSYVFLAHLRLL